MSIDTLLSWLTGDLGTPGEYIYQSIHWYTLIAIGTVIAALLIWQRCIRRKAAASRRLLVAVCVFQLAFEVIWRLIYLFIKGDSILCWWPVYPCNLNGILVPVIALVKCLIGKKALYLFGFVGGVLTFAMPDGIFCSDVLVFPILKSILQHTGILLIPLLEYIAGSYRATLKDMGWVTAGCLLHLVNCEGIDRFLGFKEDYMFFRSGLPFVIPGVPQFVTLSVFALLVLSLLAFLSDIKGSTAYVRTLGRRNRIQP